VKPSLIQLISFWPPFLVSGIRLRRYLKTHRVLEVEMGLRFWNWNHERSHFGGSLYAMTDPFYPLLIREHLEEKVEVWVKSAVIQFKRPGKGTVYARFELTQNKLQELRLALEHSRKAEPSFKIEIMDESDKLVAVVEQVVYVRRKKTLIGSGSPSLKARAS